MAVASEARSASPLSKLLAQAEDPESFFLVHTYFCDFKACRWLCETGWLFAALATVYDSPPTSRVGLQFVLHLN